MNVFRDISALPVFKKGVITIGTFDGVHTGHQRIIAQLKNEAARIGGETVLVTFHPHPRKIVSDKPLHLLNTLEEKIELLRWQQIDNLVIVPFTRPFADQPARNYIEDFLVGRFHPHTVIIGYDHHFGKERSGNFALLEEYAGKHAFELIEIPVQLIDEAAISSTRIRQCLVNGDPEEARRLLGYDYFFEGKVIEGNKLGRTLGFPTANLESSGADKLIPANGVYAVQVQLKKNDEEAFHGIFYNGMMNIGIRPTIGGLQQVTEVNIFGFDQDIYGWEARVFLKKYLRAEQKFKGLEELRQQLFTDRENALRELTYPS